MGRGSSPGEWETGRVASKETAKDAGGRVAYAQDNDGEDGNVCEGGGKEISFAGRKHAQVARSAPRG